MRVSVTLPHLGTSVTVSLIKGCTSNIMGTLLVRGRYTEPTLSSTERLQGWSLRLPTTATRMSTIKALITTARSTVSIPASAKTASQIQQEIDKLEKEETAKAFEPVVLEDEDI